MATRPSPRDEPRVPLSRERVLEAAVGLADAAGVESLTMRRLAQELGVEAMSLYHYVASKDEILNGIAEIVVSGIELPAAGADWKPAIRRMAMSAYESLVRHPWAASVLLSASVVSPARIRYMNYLLGSLREAGFSADMRDHAYHALESHIMGFVLWEVGMNLGSREDLVALATALLEQLPAEEFPHVVEHIQQHLKVRDSQDEGEFAFGLDLILDGLEKYRGKAALRPEGRS